MRSGIRTSLSKTVTKREMETGCQHLFAIQIDSVDFPRAEAIVASIIQHCMSSGSGYIKRLHDQTVTAVTPTLIE